MVTDGACERCGVQVAGVVAHAGMSTTVMAKLYKSKQEGAIEAVESVHFYCGIQVVIDEDGGVVLKLGHWINHLPNPEKHADVM